MPQVVFAPAAIRDLRRLREFLQPKNAQVARRAGEAIRQGLNALGQYPRMGRMVDELPENYREWLIDFGDSGYVARYRVDDDAIMILAIRHQKEAGYK
ncbi:MAG: type II toxin-antitoxin system RelE/ParE family toxin [Mesorhizobium sp.]|nr:type II toxin-antitoxin system RelE/ParE family toxin [Mesorhizobium sp.]MBL8576728.1 type II toxin-antitoxin system RelE/ParE family toxin [Mesorhizobium sp.]